jgi:BirA family biotin operon repressor/biotin-[acetyl-CoA-carboxylase] ligase
VKDERNVKNALLAALSEHEFVSGQQLAERLGVSRATISNYVKGLQELGLGIFSVTGKGYRLETKLTFLDAEQIKQHTSGTVTVLAVVDSTNQVMRDTLPHLKKGAVCVAEAQTAGRGRLGRKWQSPFGANLYISLLWQFDLGYQALDGLSLAVGVAVAETIETEFALPVQLKWPNDIYCSNKKMGGVLVEVEGQFSGTCSTIIGIGLNVTMSESTKIDQAWTDLSTQLDKAVDRNKLLITLINRLREALERFEQQGFSPFIESWKQKNLYHQQDVKLVGVKHSEEGKCVGIDDRGGLLLDQNGVVKAFYGGEISVRAI